MSYGAFTLIYVYTELNAGLHPGPPVGCEISWKVDTGKGPGHCYAAFICL